jgi:hypothetical protein
VSDRTAAAVRVIVVVLDVCVLLAGTFFVWLVLGITELVDDVPDWVSAGVVVVGLLTAGVTGAVARACGRHAPARRIAGVAAALHVALAACYLVALRDPYGTSTLLIGACVVAWAGATGRVDAAHRKPVPALHRRFRDA